jgi:hypothetical protein
MIRGCVLFTLEIDKDRAMSLSDNTRAAAMHFLSNNPP